MYIVLVLLVLLWLKKKVRIAFLAIAVWVVDLNRMKPPFREYVWNFFQASNKQIQCKLSFKVQDDHEVNWTAVLNPKNLAHELFNRLILRDKAAMVNGPLLVINLVNEATTPKNWLIYGSLGLFHPKINGVMGLYLSLVFGASHDPHRWVCDDKPSSNLIVSMVMVFLLPTMTG